MDMKFLNEIKKPPAKERIKFLLYHKYGTKSCLPGITFDYRLIINL